MQDGELHRFRLESETVIEVERSPVGLLGVDPHMLDVMPLEPTKRIVDQRGSQPLALLVGGYGKPLEISVVTCPPGDGVGDDAVVTRHAETTRGGGGESFMESAVVELPERIECRLVDSE